MNLQIPRASVCDPAGNCINVYGKTAITLERITLAAAVIILAALIIKVLQ